MTFVTPTGSHETPDSYLVIGLDETGHHSLRDPGFPVFGLAGCAVRVEHYERDLATPWRELKDAHFRGAKTPLHAAELREPTSTQLDALSEFFRTCPFGRVGAALASTTHGVDLFPPYHVLAAACMTRFAAFAHHFRCNGVALVAEESSEGDKLIAQAFAGRGFVAQSETGSTPLPFDTWRISKEPCIPLMEVADFVAQAAGGEVSARIRGKGTDLRKDFRAVFKDVPEELAKFTHIHYVARPPAA